MLKPTVGMELWPASALGRSSWCWWRAGQQRQKLKAGVVPSPHVPGEDDVLDGEFSALDQRGQHGVMARRWVREGNGNEGAWKTLTANTRSSDVLPAFCRPIMVMSISVAL